MITRSDRNYQHNCRIPLPAEPVNGQSPGAVSGMKFGCSTAVRCLRSTMLFGCTGLPYRFVMSCAAWNALACCRDFGVYFRLHGSIACGNKCRSSRHWYRDRLSCTDIGKKSVCVSDSHRLYAGGIGTAGGLQCR